MPKNYFIPGDLLREARQKQGLSISQLASELGVSKTFVSVVEIGKRPAPLAWLPTLISILKVRESFLKKEKIFEVVPWQTGRVPREFWTIRENRRWFFEWLTTKLGYDIPSGLTNEKGIRETISQHGGGGMFALYYGGSLEKALTSLFSDLPTIKKIYEERTPRNSVKDQDWVIMEVEKILQKEGHKIPEGLYEITGDIIRSHQKGILIDTYGGPYGIAQFAFPNHKWLFWKFKQVPKGVWRDCESIKIYLEWLRLQLGFSKIKDFYRVSANDFRDNGGRTLLALHKESPSTIIIKYYPEIDWKLWLFEKVPQGYWKEKENRISYLEWFEKRCGIKTYEDWYDIIKTDFESNHGIGLLNHYYQEESKSIYKAARELHPTYDWKEENFGRPKRRQGHLYRIICELCGPAEEVKWEHTFSHIRWTISDLPISVDIFIPRYSLAIEYQGELHFMPRNGSGIEGEKSFRDLQKRDKEKKEKLKDARIQLLEVIYNEWDGSKEFVELLLEGIVGVADESTPSAATIFPRSDLVKNLTHSWESRFYQIEKFKQEYGHCGIYDVFKQDSGLGKWLRAQARAKALGKLSFKKIDQLEKLGFDWTSVKIYPTEEEHIHNLRLYKEKHGHCCVTQYENDEFPGLGRWVHKKRCRYNKKKLPSEMIKLLEHIGLSWDPRQDIWEQRIKELTHYKSKYGHCNVEECHVEYKDLRNWVRRLRCDYKKKGVSFFTAKRLQELENLGFVLDFLWNEWQKSLSQLKEFQKENGDCRARKGTKLGNWLDRQRQAFKKRKMSEERIFALNSVGNWV
jgi:hypothetical protein